MGKDEIFENWTLKEPGYDWNLPCFITGKPSRSESDLKPTLAGLVDSVEAGQRIVAMFGGHAQLIERERPPTTLQVKVAVLEDYKGALEVLANFVKKAGGKVSRNMIQDALLNFYHHNCIPHDVETRFVPRQTQPAPTP